MRYISVLYLLCLLFVFGACQRTSTTSSPQETVNAEQFLYLKSLPEDLIGGKTYLSVYSQIYSNTKHRTQDLTATISIRNTSEKDTIFITSAKYFNTKGELTKNFLPQTIFVQPMQTFELIIDQKDDKGGTGANFIFEWLTAKQTTEPIFEAIMISTSGQQGLSFATYGKKIQ